MEQLQKVLELIEVGENTNAPVKTILKVVKKYCEEELSKKEEE